MVLSRPFLAVVAAVLMPSLAFGQTQTTVDVPAQNNSFQHQRVQQLIRTALQTIATGT
jgi:hypothetical protein